MSCHNHCGIISQISTTPQAPPPPQFYQHTLSMCISCINLLIGENIVRIELLLDSVKGIHSSKQHRYMKVFIALPLCEVCQSSPASQHVGSHESWGATIDYISMYTMG